MRSFCFALVAVLLLSSQACAQTAEVTQQTITHYYSQWWGEYDDIRWHAQGTVPANESYMLVWNIRAIDGQDQRHYRQGQLVSGTYDLATQCITGWWESGVPHDAGEYEVGVELYEYDAFWGLGDIVASDYEYVWHP